MNDICLKGVSFSYEEGKEIIANLNLNLDREKIYVIMGPSGSGKTTLLKLISGLLFPTNGKIEINGKDVTDLGAEDRNISFAFQENGLYPNQSIYENVIFALQKQKMSWAEKDQKAKDILSRFGLAPYLNAKPKYLSEGEKQRAVICKCLVKKDAAVCLMDEPLASLDVLKRQRFILFLKKLHQRRNVPLIIVMHDQQDSFLLADEILMMRGGKIIQKGQGQDLYDHPLDLQVASFLMDGLNVFSGEIKEGKGDKEIFIGKASFALPIDLKGYKNTSLLVGIPKEIISFTPYKQNFSFTAVFKEKQLVGGEKALYKFDFQGHIINVLTDDREFKENEKVKLFAALSGLKFFAASTGMNLE
ncbi:MAG: ABC transporter ATP-binding protein [Bacilli bacterium]|jgi:ABC-type sugar transport system ATPase subunit|nr:ABC transporter ATP-binding protein [Bacilli bacterium]